MKITIDNLPNFLLNSDYVRNYPMSDDNNIIILDKYYIWNDSHDVVVDDYEALYSVLDIFRYWGIDKMPYQIYDFIYQNDTLDYTDIIKEFQYLKKDASFGKEVKFLATWKQRALDKHYYRKSFIGVLESDFIYNICREGIVNLLKYAISRKHKWNTKGCDKAIKYGHVEIIKYLHQHMTEIKDLYVTDDKNEWKEDAEYPLVPWSHGALMEHACQYGQYDCLVYMHQSGTELPDSCQEASGSIECLKYCFKHGCSLVNSYGHDIVASNTECAKFLASKSGKNISAHISLSEAFESGDTEYVRFVLENTNPSQNDGWYLCESAAEYAAEYGYCEILKLLIENEFPYDSATLVIRMIEQGQRFFLESYYDNPKCDYLGCLKFAIESGWDIPDTLAVYTFTTGSVESAKLIMEKQSALVQHYKKGKLVPLPVMNKQFIIEKFAESAHLPALKCALEEFECELTEEIFNIVVGNRARDGPGSERVDTLEYLHVYSIEKYGKPLWTSTTTKTALKNGHLRYLQYLVENGCPVDKDVIHVVTKELVEQRHIYVKKKKKIAMCFNYLLVNESDMILSEDIYMFAIGLDNIVFIKKLHEINCSYSYETYKKYLTVFKDTNLPFLDGEKVFIETLTKAMTFTNPVVLTPENIHELSFIAIENEFEIIFDFLIKQGLKIGPEHFTHVMKHNRTSTIFACLQEYKVPKDMVELAIKYDREYVFKLIPYMPLPDNLAEQIVKHNSVSVLQYLLTRDVTFDCNDELVNIAIVHNNIKLFKLLLEKGYKWDDNTLGQIDKIKKKKNKSWNENDYQVDFIKTIIGYGLDNCKIKTPKLYLMIYKFCSWRNYERTTILWENQFPVTKEVLYASITVDNLKVTKYLTENCFDGNIPWDIDFYRTAIDRGCVEILKFAHTNGCPFDESLLEFVNQEKYEHAMYSGCVGYTRGRIFSIKKRLKSKK